MSKIYEWHDRFDFGKYKGEQIDEVFQKDPAFLEECLAKNSDFHITINTCKPSR